MTAEEGALVTCRWMPLRSTTAKSPRSRCQAAASTHGAGCSVSSAGSDGLERRNRIAESDRKQFKTVLDLTTRSRIPCRQWPRKKASTRASLTGTGGETSSGMNWANLETAEIRCPQGSGPVSEQSPPWHIPARVRRRKACRLWFLFPKLTEEMALRSDTDGTYIAEEIGGPGHFNEWGGDRALCAVFRNIQDDFARPLAPGATPQEPGFRPDYPHHRAQGRSSSVTGEELSESTVVQAESLLGAKARRRVDELAGTPSFGGIVATQMLRCRYWPLQVIRGLADRLSEDGNPAQPAPLSESASLRHACRRWPAFMISKRGSIADQIALPDLIRRSGIRLGGRQINPHVPPSSVVILNTGNAGHAWSRKSNQMLHALADRFMPKRERIQ